MNGPRPFRDRPARAVYVSHLAYAASVPYVAYAVHSGHPTFSTPAPQPKGRHGRSRTR
ncbi:hypothetical protein GCM10010252_41070 [Streptomyces aureoverticillatus]|nr:hypothetical protein GCM10010252_41070 [Streptomyces aureoverticillatus]